MPGGSLQGRNSQNDKDEKKRISFLGGGKMTAKDLKSLRTNLGLSITDLAKALKCHFTLISLWEREKSPIPEKRVDQLRKFFQSKMSEKTIPTLKEKIYIDKPDVTTFDRDILAANNIRRFAFVKQNTSGDTGSESVEMPVHKRDR